MSKKTEKRSFKDLKIIFEKYVCMLYREAERRLALSNYDSRYRDVEKQRRDDYRLIEHVNLGLAMCSEESARFLMKKCIHPDEGKYYYGHMSYSSLYRLHLKAIYEIVDCLGL